MSGKRKHGVILLEKKYRPIQRLDGGETITKVEKYRPIQRLDGGETITKVAADMGVSEVTVEDWSRKRKDIEKWISQSALVSGNTKRKVMKHSKHEKTSEALFIWFTQMREKGNILPRPILQSKALEFYNLLENGAREFAASVVDAAEESVLDFANNLDISTALNENAIAE
ncbi:hypothetical protein QE152_g13105 [Popillia japonica]|uniref:HTH CENPB-type domain-containing protein n=1 Tax=Popillia japonica TaxID=7064 RepID=A0AAW1LEM1_POPJA